MNRNKFWAAVSKALVATTVTVIVTLMLVPGARGQSKYKVLYSFSYGSDGGEPRAGLILDQAGSLYGTTFWGGAYGPGTVFKLTHNSDGSWTETVLYSFTGGADGYNPWSTLVFDKAGNLYGTTMYGGVYRDGNVFELTPNPDGSWTESVLHSFAGQDGSQPYALTFDEAGTLYGTAGAGGAYGYGDIYKLTPNPDGTWKQRVIHSFTGGKDGAYPFRDGGLTFDAAGNLYTTTPYGGAYGYGVALELMPTVSEHWKEKVLHAFRAHPGEWPTCRLTFDTAGNLYGTTSNAGGDGGGGNPAGVVFKLTPGSAGKWIYNILYSFKGTDGYDPALGVILDAAGNLYGSTYGGGAYNRGTIFKLVPRAGKRWKEAILHTFTGGSDGGNPEGFVFDTAGNFYGVAAYSGANGGGVVFEITP